MKTNFQILVILFLEIIGSQALGARKLKGTDLTTIDLATVCKARHIPQSLVGKLANELRDEDCVKLDEKMGTAPGEVVVVRGEKFCVRPSIDEKSADLKQLVDQFNKCAEKKLKEREFKQKSQISTPGGAA